MIASDPVAFTFQGFDAYIYVIRNDGYCWGRIVRVDGAKFDVMHIRKDMYDEEDEYIIEKYIALARNPKYVKPAVGWL